MKGFRLSQAGNSVLMAMGVTALAGMAAISAFKNFNVSASSFRASRVKNAMMAVEAQVRILAQQPEAYIGCGSNNASECALNTAYFASIATLFVPGAVCPSPPARCGVVVSGLSYTAADKIFRANISYQGREVSVKPILVQQAIPVEVLQADTFHCGNRFPDRPIFAGFDSASGAPVCVGFPSCPTGTYASGMNISGHTLNCTPLPADVNCGSQAFINYFGWGGGSSASASCAPTETPPFSGGLSGSPPAAMAYVDRTPPDTSPPPPPPPPPPPAPAPSDPGPPPASAPSDGGGGGSAPAPSAPVTGTWVYVGSNIGSQGSCPFAAATIGSASNFQNKGPCTDIGRLCGAYSWHFSNSQTYVYQCMAL